MGSDVSKWVHLARERQARDLRELDGHGYRWNPDRADRVIGFLTRFCCFTKGEWAGQPFELQPWQTDDILRPLFGWEREDGTRRFRTAYSEVPRKNGKTEVGAGVGLYLTGGDNEDGAEVYCAATKRDQAKICHDRAVRMVKLSSELRRFFKTLRNNIHVPELWSKFEPLGADSDTLDGLHPHGVIIDELHAHKDRRVYDVLMTAFGARRQPLMFEITTAGVFNPTSIGFEEHTYAQQVLEGVVEDDAYFAYIACADEGDEPGDPETWQKANPNYGITVKPDYIANLWAKAQSQSSFLNVFLRYHLNIWTQVLVRWIPMEKWDACQEPLDEAELIGKPCYAGLQLSSTTELAALLLIFERDGGVDIVSRFWVPADTITARAKVRGAPYDAWVRDGFLTETPGNITDFDWIKRDVTELGAKYDIQELAIGQRNSTQLQTELADTGLVVVPSGWGYPDMSEPCKELEKLVISGRLRHGANPILRWNAANAVVDQSPAEELKPNSDKSSDRIDGIRALVMGLGRLLLNAGGSVYEDRGILTLG